MIKILQNSLERKNEKSTEIYVGVRETVRKDIHGIWMKVWRIPQAGGREAGKKRNEEDCTGISFAEKTGVDEASEYEI